MFVRDSYNGYLGRRVGAATYLVTRDVGEKNPARHNSGYLIRAPPPFV